MPTTSRGRHRHRRVFGRRSSCLLGFPLCRAVAGGFISSVPLPLCFVLRRRWVAAVDRAINGGATCSVRTSCLSCRLGRRTHRPHPRLARLPDRLRLQGQHARLLGNCRALFARRRCLLKPTWRGTSRSSTLGRYQLSHRLRGRVRKATDRLLSLSAATRMCLVRALAACRMAPVPALLMRTLRQCCCPPITAASWEMMRVRTTVTTTTQEAKQVTMP